jgi:hypothetical protein
MGRNLHSTNPCINILNEISDKTRTKLTKSSKISLIIVRVEYAE